ncbi:hypothetical protein GPZ77_12855 [Streptomyces sp. QHH-9511]|uniref:hypothetical protein n=1 Tax=Streptomyces sp. QHH-9511 TaxID=2684468 RepID=UPI001316FAD5|nr:hypothetical protein [Streptomyces sp. QHH-9511]QGZ49153.1 hypothetical protein GPZ77_12855 [Streptomyces sp. QHH-9511]
MPRPNAAQLAYGSATVVFATVALLLLSRTTTALGVAVICATGLILGLLVAVTMPAHRKAEPSAVAHVPQHGENRAPAVRVGAGADTRIGS